MSNSRHWHRWIGVLILLVLAGCVAGPAPANVIVPTETATIQPTATPFTPTDTPTVHPEARLKTQCLDVGPTLPFEIASNGIVVLKSSISITTNTLNMATGQITQISGEEENQIHHVVSPDRKFFAFSSSILSPEGLSTQRKLVIATADGQRLKEIPWEDEWVGIPSWLDNQHLAISFFPKNGSDQIAASLLVINPFSGERKILHPNFPRFFTPSKMLPFWEGWQGVIYDPTFTLAIYPRFIGESDEMYTYAIWDLSKQQPVASLENIFAAFSLYDDAYPMPKWSPDGSQLVFEGVVKTADPIEYELYRVNRNGQVERLTHLTSIALVQDKNFSWSPDGRYIAMFLTKWGENAYETSARVAVLDTLTLDVMDYCLIVKGYSFMGNIGELPPSPIWSPDGKQFLVVDWYEKDHNRVILVDIEKGIAAQIAEDTEPLGWLLAP